MGKISAVLVNRELLTDTLAKFTYHPERPLEHEPGQYTGLVLRRPGLDRSVGRAYSIASAPSRDVELYIRWVTSGGTGPGEGPIYGLKRKGLMTTELFADDLSGVDFSLTDGSGHFIFDPHDDRDLCLVGSGTGIVPTLSIVRQLARKGNYKGRIIVIHAVSRADDLGYHKELEFLSGRSSSLRLQYHSAVSKEPGGEEKYAGGFLFKRAEGKEGSPDFDEIDQAIREGRIEDTKIDNIYGEPVTKDNMKFMLCGIPGVTKKVTRLLEGRGFVPGSDIITEDYWTEKDAEEVAT